MINLSNVKVAYSSRVLFKNANFLVRPGDKIGLVGPNGAGKSTVFRLITGEEKPDEGEIIINANVTIGYFSQDVGEMSGKTVMEQVIAAAGKVFELGKQLAEMEDQMGDPDFDYADDFMEKYGAIQEEYINLNGYDK
jgi:ATP-binding cassette subfamily F protein 3